MKFKLLKLHAAPKILILTQKAMFQQKGGVRFLLLLGRSCTESPVQDECGHLLQFQLAGNAELCVSAAAWTAAGR